MPEGVQNTGAEVSELQLMAENQINMEATVEAAEDSPPQTGGDAVVHSSRNLRCLHCLLMFPTAATWKDTYLFFQKLAVG